MLATVIPSALDTLFVQKGLWKEANRGKKRCNQKSYWGKRREEEDTEKSKYFCTVLLLRYVLLTSCRFLELLGWERPSLTSLTILQGPLTATLLAASWTCLRPYWLLKSPNSDSEWSWEYKVRRKDTEQVRGVSHNQWHYLAATSAQLFPNCSSNNKSGHGLAEQSLAEPWADQAHWSPWQQKWLSLKHLFFLTPITGHRVGRDLEEGHCAYPSVLKQHLLHLYQENSTWFLPVSSRASLFLLLERLFLIFDSNLITCQIFLVLLVMENRLFSSSLLQPFIHWKTVIMSPLSLLFRANNPTVFNLSSQVMVFRPLIVLPPLLWTLSNWAMPLEQCGACRRAQCPGWGLPGTQQSASSALWILQTLLLFKHRSVAFAFFSAARHCRRMFSLWSTAPDPLVSFLHGCHPGGCSLFAVCAG